ncbi:hypothetical protein ACF1BB_25265 [Streptomyces griseoluteus]|uniref:hypothetical protein n=1 Tax=Streptomyces griseoluteus TaxID=29306 RepID=UPI0037015A91
MIEDQDGTLRLLPWTGTDGKRCYLVGDGTGYLYRVADSMETMQLAMADEHAADMLADHGATSAQLRFLAARLAEALRHVHRVAESRGARLAGAGRGDASAQG